MEDDLQMSGHGSGLPEENSGEPSVVFQWTMCGEGGNRGCKPDGKLPASEEKQNSGQLIVMHSTYIAFLDHL